MANRVKLLPLESYRISLKPDMAISRQELLAGTGYVVDSFREKPDRATAEKYLQAGNYYWNSGMFAFTIGHLRQEFEDYQPEIAALMNRPFTDVLAGFAAMPDISFDYAVVEKSQTGGHCPTNCLLERYWFMGCYL